MKRVLLTSLVYILSLMAVCLVLLGICLLSPDAAPPPEKVTFIASPLYSEDMVGFEIPVVSVPTTVENSQEEALVEETTTVENSQEEALVEETTTDIIITGNNNLVVTGSDVQKYYSIHVGGIVYTLEYALQDFLYDTCMSYEVEDYYELFIALMYRESSYSSKLISYSNDYGLMQINVCNHSWLQEVLGVTDFLEPKQSILCGVYMLSDLLKKYDTVEMALMAYNLGPTGAKRYWAKGIYSTQYVETTLGYLNNNLIPD